MEFNEKLQKLRKQKGLTQEELAELLYVSRTAISKWESGRGYPSIESLKQISKIFSMTIDELLSCDEIINIAETDVKQKEDRFCDLVFGLLDISVISFFFLPFFKQISDTVIQAVSLLALSDIELYMKLLYCVMVSAITIFGVLVLALINLKAVVFGRVKRKISLILNLLTVFLFIISTQIYASVILLVFLIIKASLLIKW